MTPDARPLRRLLQAREPDLARLALEAARALAYPDLESEAYLARLDQWAAVAGDARGSRRGQAERLLRYLADEVGLRGNLAAYDDPRNSYLNEVLDRRLGLPITLALIYAATAERCGLRAWGVGLPGHFIARVEVEEGECYVDLFHGRLLTARDCARLVRESTSYAGAFRPEWLNPTPAPAILLRLLNNLRLTHVRRQAWEPALAVLQLMRVVEPDAADLVRDEGLIYYNQGNWQRAAERLDAYLERNPGAADARSLQQLVGRRLSDWGRLN